MKRKGQWRFTKRINNNYCAYELKTATYKDLFNLQSNREIENEVDCDLTLAIDRLGEIEDIMQEYGIYSVEELKERLKKL